jgi:hypothetical protein
MGASVTILDTDLLSQTHSLLANYFRSAPQTAEQYRTEKPYTSVVTRMAINIKILILIIFSSFEGTDLSRSMLANCFLPQRWDRGAMGQRRPPWLLQPLLKISYR